MITPVKPIKYSTPSPVVATTPEPQPTPTEYSHDAPSYDYQEIIVDPPSPTPVYHPTTFTPDEKYLESIKASLPPRPVYETTPSPVLSTQKQFFDSTPKVFYVTTAKPEYEPLPDITSESIPEVLTKLQESNQLPSTLTADNVDGSIKTLVKILNNIKQKDPKPLPEYNNHANDDYDYYGSDDDGKVALQECSRVKICLSQF